MFISVCVTLSKSGEEPIECELSCTAVGYNHIRRLRLWSLYVANYGPPRNQASKRKVIQLKTGNQNSD